MNNDRLEGKWDKFTAKVKQKWGKLTNDEIKQAEGNKDELMARIQEKYGESKESIAKKFNDFMGDDDDEKQS